MASKTEFPTIFKKNSNGSTQEWTIWVEGNVVKTRYGQVGGAMQETIDVVENGKNIGKKNETTAGQQAENEARSAWEKKLKSGYHQEQKAAEKGQIDTSFIAGGIDPMLAHKYRDHAIKMPFPALAQPKFDGARCIAIIKKGKVTLWSRTRKAITGVPHIIIYLSQIFAGKDAILDGELYNHDYKDRFEDLMSFIRQQKAKPGHEAVEYHVYDTVIPGASNTQRNAWLTSNIPANHPKVKLVETVEVADDAALKEYFSDCLERGYEGCMVRSKAGTYQNKRSYNLLKVKEFDDGEFEICGTREGRGKMAGKAIFVCKVDPKLPTVYKADGTVDDEAPNQFGAKMKGKLSNLAQYLNNKKVVGKMLTVQYQDWTNTKKPRFAVGKGIRDYE